MSYGFDRTNKKKVTIVGEHSAGKTSFLLRFLYDTFNDAYVATIGIDFLFHTLRMPDRTINLHIWDTAGQERFKSMYTCVVYKMRLPGCG